MRLGAIGDDFTGSGDLANTLAREGMRVRLWCGVPSGPAGAEEAAVVALKSRTIPAEAAVSQSLAALDWLRGQGAEQVVFKVCSTFDSTPEGNIGQVAEALHARLGGAVPVCPAFPTLKRSVYMGHLFVADRLLSESGMERHPLTPMTDPDLRRWLARQTRLGVGHVPLATVAQGPEAVRKALEAEAAAGRPLAVVDAVADADLRAIGAAAKGLALLVGGSGIALGLPASFGATGGGSDWRAASGPGAVLSGSCSAATRAQVARYRDRAPALGIDPEGVLEGRIGAAHVADWMLARIDRAPMAYSTAEPEQVAAVQARFGRDRSAAVLEDLFGEVARRLAAAGVSRLVTAGGETSGAVVEALGVPAMDVGPEIAPGVPALSASDRPLALALKSGNFGGEDFFAEALAALEG